MFLYIIMQRKCPYCAVSFGDQDEVYAFHHKNPTSFHLVHVVCLNTVKKGVLDAIGGESVGKCPSCMEESTYMGQGAYVDFVRSATPYLNQEVDDVVANSKSAKVYEIGEGFYIKKRRAKKQSKKQRNKSKGKTKSKK
jgi:hypothetical protein